ncbi:zinc ribbon domain-containing protein [Anaerotignum faecicola]|jgi:DNA-directed RNA polymerase subunit RPC12/RpoP
MYCSKCGYEAKDGEKFCVKCGAILNDTTSKKTIKLTCEDCGGEMNIEAGRNVLTCPYCGSKKLIAESDEVTIARINKESDAERMRFEKEKREYEEELRVKKDKEDTKFIIIALPILVLTLVIICVLLNCL